MVTGLEDLSPYLAVVAATTQTGLNLLTPLAGNDPLQQRSTIDIVEPWGDPVVQPHSQTSEALRSAEARESDPAECGAVALASGVPKARLATLQPPDQQVATPEAMDNLAIVH